MNVDQESLEDVRQIARRAIEALRSGVPNGESVKALGTTQRSIVDRFEGLLTETSDATSDRSSLGMVIKGGFGSGKSHLLEYLGEVALAKRFVVSKIVISKETPLHNPTAMFRAAIASAKVPERSGSAIDEIAAALKFDSPRYAALYSWLHQPECKLDQRLSASLRLFESFQGDEEFAEKLTQFWAGEPFSIAEMRKRLREAGWLGGYSLRSTKAMDLSLDRFAFVSRLIHAAGFSGWVLLIDEVELIGRYSLMQRAKSYAEIRRWVEGSKKYPPSPIISVLTSVDDFEGEVLIGKGDYNKIPQRLGAKDRLEEAMLSIDAIAGMKILGSRQSELQSPNDNELNATYEAIRRIHGAAYNWDPPHVGGLERLGSNRMRQYVRAWINEWDLIRLDPTFIPQTTVTKVEIDYGEDGDLTQLFDLLEST
ncbi:unnamed protein product [Acidithrix sp. C25]|nr:unnamed protein product [Acidithrix sp. C25]